MKANRAHGVSVGDVLAAMERNGNSGSYTPEPYVRLHFGRGDLTAWECMTPEAARILADELRQAADIASGVVS